MKFWNESDTWGPDWSAGVGGRIKNKTPVKNITVFKLGLGMNPYSIDRLCSASTLCKGMQRLKALTLICLHYHCNPTWVFIMITYLTLCDLRFMSLWSLIPANERGKPFLLSSQRGNLSLPEASVCPSASSSGSESSLLLLKGCRLEIGDMTMPIQHRRPQMALPEPKNSHKMRIATAFTQDPASLILVRQRAGYVERFAVTPASRGQN